MFRQSGRRQGAHRVQRSALSRLHHALVELTCDRAVCIWHRSPKIMGTGTMCCPYSVCSAKRQLIMNKFWPGIHLWIVIFSHKHHKVCTKQTCVVSLPSGGKITTLIPVLWQLELGIICVISAWFWVKGEGATQSLYNAWLPEPSGIGGKDLVLGEPVSWPLPPATWWNERHCDTSP